jgi:type I restriction enzyme R subunit
LHFEPRLVDVHVDKKTIDQLFENFKEAAALTDEEADSLNKKFAKMAAFLKSPERVSKIVEDIASHFREKVAPHGFKAMIVTPDRYACTQYKEELDKYFPEESSKVVISTSANDDYDFKQKWGVDKSQQKRVVDEFNDPIAELQYLIVTAKLLTGFDAPYYRLCIWINLLRTIPFCRRSVGQIGYFLKNILPEQWITLACLMIRPKRWNLMIRQFSSLLPTLLN